MSRILIGSPVKQKATILKEFLTGLDEAEKGSNEIVYFFVDDNTEAESSDLLSDFAKSHTVIIKKGIELFDITKAKETDEYIDHTWKTVNLEKVTVYKDTIIDYCVSEKFDYLFLIDSDIVLDKRVIPQLLSDNVDIVSSIFYSQWQKNGMLTPQCFWIPDVYTRFKAFNVPITGKEAHQIRLDMYEKLKTPGLYKVDGLGACTLIKREPLEKGVSFKEIYNLAIPGEDRPFCIRATVLGYELFMDSTYPSYHIHKEKYLDRVDEFKRDGFKFDMCCTYEEEPPKKKLNPILKFILRVAKKIVRDLSV